MFRVLVVVMLLAIIGSLFSGLWFLYRDRGAGRRTVMALTVRIGLALVLFVALLIGFIGGYLDNYSQ